MGEALKFQSTRPRGARLSTTDIATINAGFNPRARAGRDFQLSPSAMALICFNPRARAGRDPIIHAVWNHW